MAKPRTATPIGVEVLAAHGLNKAFGDAGRRITVLDQCSLSVHEGERVAIIGASGAGKSTLLHILGGLETPDSGKVLIGGQDLATHSDAVRTKLRNQNLGFVYQFHHLLAEFTAEENVALPLIIREVPRPQALERAREVLAAVGLGQRVKHLPGELSGGERQRVAIARALVGQPKVVLADEPTGNLDRQTAAMVFDLIVTLNRERRAGLVVVTHDPQLAQRCDRVLSLRDGTLVQLP